MLHRHITLLNFFLIKMVAIGNNLPPFLTVYSYVWCVLNTILCFAYLEEQKMGLMNDVVDV
jgi:hypothetical protein